MANTPSVYCTLAENNIFTNLLFSTFSILDNVLSVDNYFLYIQNILTIGRRLDPCSVKVWPRCAEPHAFYHGVCFVRNTELFLGK